MYDYLLTLADEEDLLVAEIPFKSNAKGLCHGNIIGINKKIETQAEKACVLAEELGHYFTGCGDILEQSNVSCIKQELKAREWAYKKLITLSDLFSAFKHGVHNRFELAEYLSVTEDFLQEAIDYFKLKYGPFYDGDGYIIYFEPFGIIELFKNFKEGL